MPFAESTEKYDKILKIYVHEKCIETGLQIVYFKANKATFRLKNWQAWFLKWKPNEIFTPLGINWIATEISFFLLEYREGTN